MDMLHKTTEVKAGDFLKKVGDLYKYRLCSPRIDGYDDIVEPGGLDRTDFRNNPICLVGHAHDFIGGRWLNDRIESDGCLYADLQLAPPVSPRIRELHALVENNILNACSIGFAPVEARPRAGSTKGGQHYTKGILREASLVAVGANPDAIRIAKSLGVSESTIQKVLVMKPLSVGERVRQARASVRKARAMLGKTTNPVSRATLMKAIAILEDMDREQTARYSGVQHTASSAEQKRQQEAAAKAAAVRAVDEMMKSYVPSADFVRSQFATPPAPAYEPDYKPSLTIHGQPIYRKKKPLRLVEGTMANVIGVCIDGQWLPIHAPPPPPLQSVDQGADSNKQVAVLDTKSDVDLAIDHLAQVARLAQGLQADVDRRRVRDLVHALSGLLMASTYLTGQDQERFQQALRKG
jgi:HK97 family phage prohead protease